MRHAALALPVAAAFPIGLASGACGTQEWAFYGPAQEPSGEASLDDVAASVDATVEDADGRASDGNALDGTCGPDGSRCPVSCAGGAACPTDAPVCTQPYAICQPCRSNDDCDTVRSGPICDQSGACAPECTADRSCPDSHPRCDRPIGRCVRCLSASDCPAGDVCLGSSHSCASPQPAPRDP
jgi:hypothetical protein